MEKHDRPPPLKVAVSGARGLVGRALCTFLTDAGHQVLRLVRDLSQATPDSPPYNASAPTEPTQPATLIAVAPWHDEVQVKRLEGIDAVIHLAGQAIADRRWSAKVKQQIRDSRVLKTQQLSQALAALNQPPKTFLCASAIGIYGDRGDEILADDSAPGSGYLPAVAVQWEAACQPAREAGIRVANLRLGVVLSTDGGALQKMLMPAKLGLGGPLGSGRQWWSWIDLVDTTAAIYHTLITPSLSGAVNVVAPQAVRQADFAKTLGTVLHRPAVIPTPAFALRLALGEMADPLLLASARVEPAKLVASGFSFPYGRLIDSLQHQVGTVS